MLTSYRIGSLFSGIGGLELGLERAGVGRVVWQCEIDTFARSVLARHWPDVTRFEDVRTLGTTIDVPAVDVLCGGFPCQDISHANVASRLGLAGAKSGLWHEYRRIVELVRPSFVVVENVAAWRDWLPVVRLALHDLGYASLPLQLSAADVGAPHGRPRVFVVAYPYGDGKSHVSIDAQVAIHRAFPGRSWWSSHPAPMGVDDGPRGRLDGRRLTALGNAVVPQVGEVVGCVLLKIDRALRAVEAA